MEKTLKNKTKFFTQYWGQNILMEQGKYLNRYNVEYLDNDDYPNHWLELRSVSQITKEDLYFVGELFGYEEFYGIQHENVYYKARQIIDNLFYHPDSHCKVDLYLCLFDYLRSKGYALPWLGLSVEEQIHYGWIKLKENDGTTI